ncbi:MAG: hypothetical protein QM777_08815 [Pseudorhodoferax sp.]
MTEAVQHIEDEDRPPTWAEMRESGGMVVDDEDVKLAVYVGGHGHVVVMVGPSDHAAEYMPVHHAAVRSLIEALEKAIPEAVEEERQTELRWEAAEREYQAHVAGQPSAGQPV